MTKLILSIEAEADRDLVLALAQRLNLPVEEVGPSFSENDFWEVIATLDADTEDASPAIGFLSKKSRATIIAFADHLAEKLYMLDKQVYAEHLAPEDAWGGEGYFSADHFLDARAYVIAKGKDFFERVLADPSQMPKGKIFEAITYLPGDAWEAKTGTDFDYLPNLNYFTFSNAAGWPERTTTFLNGG